MPRIDLGRGCATSEQHRRELTADDLLDRLFIAHLMPDQIETLCANAAREFSATFENGSGKTSATCLRPIREV